MSPPAQQTLTPLAQLRALARRYRLQLILALRVTVSAVSSLALAQLMHLKLPLWAVLTSLIVTQMSLGRSIKVATDYLMGTLAGVAYGGALAILIPHESRWALFAVLALAIAPLASIAAFKTNFNVRTVLRARLRTGPDARASRRGSPRGRRMGPPMTEGAAMWLRRP